MKKQIMSSLATLTLIIPMAIAGFAGLDARVKADIPFDFLVGGKQLPAGKYVVERLNATGALIIRSTDNKQAANFNVNNVTDRGSQEARLVFRRYGNQTFLAQIYDGLSNQGQELPKSKQEREAAKKRDIITQNIIGPQIETVVAEIAK